jgi:DNA-binding LacI/PurR family transcriptional regulator
MNKFNTPLYLKIYEILVEGISSGKYKEGDRLPSEKELADEYNVSRITSKRALEMLANNGHIHRMPGKGSFVKNVSLLDIKQKTRSLPTNRLLIGIIITNFDDTFGTRLFESIQYEAVKNNCFIITCFSYGRQELEEKAIADMIEIGVKGIIIIPVHGENYNTELLKLVLNGFPIVLVDKYLKGIPAAYVGSDNVSAAKKATDYLLDLGHRNISFISPPVLNTSTIEDRREGFLRSHIEKGVATDEALWLTNLTSTHPKINDNVNLEKDVDSIKSLIKDNPCITSFLAIEYSIALMALEAAKELGKRVPEDISIVCFDGPNNYWKNPFFTCIYQDEGKMGIETFKLLIKQIENAPMNNKVFIDTELIVGQSTKKIEQKV